MAVLRAFRAVRPRAELAERVAALPYDVYTSEEARREVSGRPLSFLNIDRPETQLPPGAGIYSDDAYEKARELFQRERSEGVFLQEERPVLYLYEETVVSGELFPLMPFHSQTGIVGLSAVDDYLFGRIRRHENTRREKEEDRVRHIRACKAQTGPIFLCFRESEELRLLFSEWKKRSPLFDFVSEDGIRHRVYRLDREEEIRAAEEAFSPIERSYIADGHHRAASAVRVSEEMRREQPDYSGREEFNFFLSVLFPEEELRILPYNRLLRDLSGMDEAAFLRALSPFFSLERSEKGAVLPASRGDFGLFLPGGWYRLSAREELRGRDPVHSLDVSFLQDFVFDGILGIKDPGVSKRLRFVGGIRGAGELEEAVKSGEMAAAFTLFPTSMEELLCVADAELLMPPKSTWFEPKLRSGLFIHDISGKEEV